MLPARATGLGMLAGVMMGVVWSCSSVDTEFSAKQVAAAPAPPAIPERPGLQLDLGPNVAMDLVLIPAGEFMMGSGDSPAELARLDGAEGKSFKDEYPQHRVRITHPFYMGVQEVTGVQFVMVMAPERMDGTREFTREAFKPLETVSWAMAVEFCRRLSVKTGREVRLPTEAEWEYACRAGSTTRFFFGDDDNQLSTYAWYWANSGHRKREWPRKSNPWGLYSMHGNVAEWCRDWYDEDYYDRSPEEDPVNTTPGKYRVIRGGSVLSDPVMCRSASRSRAEPSSEPYKTSFRVVVPAGP
jgi:formylglycine-generating enzyme required for sulfatase activity